MNVSQLHTIYVLIGPTNCGKTYFTQNFLIPALNKAVSEFTEPNIQHISSDAIRRQLLGRDYDKYDSVMLESSHQAFSILKNYVDNVIQFPINAHYVIVDSTGLNEHFRESMIDIAKKNGYRIEAIIFNYLTYADFFKYGGDKKIIATHINRLRTSVIKEIGKGFHDRHYIRNHDPIINVNLTEGPLYAKCILAPKLKYFIVGDLHECIDELKALLLKADFGLENDIITSQNCGLILVGDLIDKGHKTVETIEFLHKNILESKVPIKIVRGNHDRAVMRLLTGATAETSYPTDFVSTYYNSYLTFKDNKELTKKFLELESLMVPFLRYTASDHQSKSFYVTHVPCADKYVGKLSPEAQKAQRQTTVDRSEFAWPYIKEQITPLFSAPFVVSGHFAFKQAHKEANRLLIDTGCIHGNKLTGVLLGHRMTNPKWVNVDFMKLQTPFPLPLESIVKEPVVVENLRPGHLERINKIIEHKVNFISGTISPAGFSDNLLESLEAGLDYYVKAGVSRVTLQPKYMGSRCNVYLFADHGYAISRNGFPIHKDLSSVYETLQQRFGSFMKEHQIKMMLFDGELLPWKVLGEGLIDHTFGAVSYAIHKELEVLKETGFEQCYNELVQKMSATNFRKDIVHKPLKEIYTQYGTTVAQIYRELISEMPDHVSLDSLQQGANLYHTQIELYGADGPITYKPFSLLKLVYEDGKEWILGRENNYNFNGESDLFNFVSTDEQLILDLTDMDSYTKAENFYRNLTTVDKYEGVVIKPDQWNGKIAPCLKVRNPDYLTLVYGYDYQMAPKYKKLMKKKSITKKIATSIDEYKLGHQMLETKYDAFNDPQYTQLLIKFFDFEETESTLDPRL